MTTTWYIVVKGPTGLVIDSTGPQPSLEDAVAKTTAFRDAQGHILTDERG